MTIRLPARDRSLVWLLAGSLGLAVLVIAALGGADAGWDTRNYHLYNPFALLNKPFGTDVAPAHMQSFFSPTLDLYFYALLRTVTWTPLFNALLALPQALAVVLAYLLTRRVLRPAGWADEAACVLFAVIGATGAAGLSTLASAMSEMAPAALFVAALLVLVPADFAPPSLRRMVWAGLLIGLACGLKLTMSYATIATVIALFLIPRRARHEWLTRPVCFGLGVGLGAAALSGYWWAIEWARFGNPLFPIANDVFRSPWAPPNAFVDRTFLPHSFGEALLAPWEWALRLSWRFGESRLRDPRFSLAIAAALVCLARAVLSRRNVRWPSVFLPGLFVIGFALWRLEFSIFRYLASLELLTGTMMALAVRDLFRAPARRRWLPAAAAMVAAACAVATVEPQLARSPRGTPPFAVAIGKLPPDSLLLLLDNEPMAYLAAFLDPRVRVVATNDFFMTLDGENPMQPLVEQAIREHPGPIWGVDCPSNQGQRSEQTLARYGLVRGDCQPVVSNVSPDPIRLCRLTRLDGGRSASLSKR